MVYLLIEETKTYAICSVMNGNYFLFFFITFMRLIIKFCFQQKIKIIFIYKQNYFTHQNTCNYILNIDKKVTLIVNTVVLF